MIRPVVGTPGAVAASWSTAVVGERKHQQIPCFPGCNALQSALAFLNEDAP